MKFTLLLFSFFLFFSCKQSKPKKIDIHSNFVLSFGSCNNQNVQDTMWSEVLKNNPSVWVWGGDIIYADTEDMTLMKAEYNKVTNSQAYKDFKDTVAVIGTWDDHDYGMNDAGEEYAKKDSAQQLLLDFLEVPDSDLRRKRKGVYFSKTYPVKEKSIKIIALDTRYFRTALTKDPTGKKRYVPSNSGSMLGSTQWEWLANELQTSTSDFNVIVSSIQFLSQEHGFEGWGNMPLEVKKLENIIINSKAKGVIILSGDRHIAEISSKKLEELEYPLIDFTASGLTHSYEIFSGEPNVNRVSKVVTKKNFGILKFDLKTNMVIFEIRGEGNVLLEYKTQKY